MRRNKFSVNVSLFLVTMTIVSVTVGLTDSFAIKILSNMVTEFESLGSAMPNYSNYVDTFTYFSGSVNFNPKAMAGFYQLTENLKNSILPPNFLKEDTIIWEKDSGGSTYPKLNVSTNQLLKDNWVLLFVLAIIIVITLMVPIVGMIFCCCRCCDKCGVKSEASDKKKDFLQKMIQGGILIGLCSLLLMGVVCAFATNHALKEGINEFPDNIRKSYNDAQTYLRSVTDQADNLLSTNYKEFLNVFKDTIGNSGTMVMEQMSSWNQTLSLYDLQNFIDTIPNIKANITKLNDDITLLKSMVDNATNDLGLIKDSLTSTLSSCVSEIPQCAEINTQISSFNIMINPSLIPSVGPTLDELNKVNEIELQKAVNQGKNNLEDLKSRINSTLKGFLNAALSQVDTAGMEISNNLQNMTNIVNDLVSDVNVLNTTLEDGYWYINTYSPYFYYGGLLISIVLLLIPFSIGIGLIWGTFGKRPEKYRSNSCSKGIGSSFLIGATVIIFTFTIIIGLATLVMSIVGLVLDRGICYPLRHPSQSTVIKIIDDYVVKTTDNSMLNMDLHPSDVLIRCRNNESIYRVFNLSQRYNLEILNTSFDVNGTVNQATDTLRTEIEMIMNNTFTIINSADFNILKGIRPNINIIGFEEQLNRNITNMDIGNLISSLQQLSILVINISAPISTIIDVLNNFNNYLKLMTDKAYETLELAKTVNSELLMNSSSFEAAITKLLNDIEQVQTNIQTLQSEMIVAAQSYGEILKNQVQGYLTRVINVTTYELGQCGPLNVALNSTLIATCDKIILPWNGFWTALFISLLVFIPTIILSITLASLYKKHKLSKQYMGGQRFKVDKKPKTGKKINMPYPSKKQTKHETRYDDMAPKFNPYPQNETQATRF